MLQAPTEESPRISAIRVMHFSIAPSIPTRGGCGGEKWLERKREGGGEKATAQRISHRQNRVILVVYERILLLPYTPNPPCVYVCCVCLHPHPPQLAVDIKYVSH